MIGIDYTEEDAEKFVDSFNQYLDKFNRESGLPYFVKASVGYYILPPEEEMELEGCIHEADARLYEYKRKKKEKKMDNILRPEVEQGGCGE